MPDQNELIAALRALLAHAPLPADLRGVPDAYLAARDEARELLAQHDAEDDGTSRWECPRCHSTDVEIGLPVWFKETAGGTLIQRSIDAEADPLWWYCNNCDESDSHEPDRHEPNAD